MNHDFSYQHNINIKPLHVTLQELTLITESQLESVISCLTEGCRRSLKINPFVTKMA